MSTGAWMPRWLVPAVMAAVLVPLAAAVVAQRNADWHPVFDMAMTELRVRDVGGRHTPLIGLQGRIGPSGSHPGPLSFFLLAPVYRLLGSSAFALQVATAAFHGLAAVTAILVASRRRDGRVVAGVGLVLLLLMQGYGLGPLTEPWNPYLPVLWFVAFLVAAWAVLDGDLLMVLPAVAAASICAQTHVPYLAVGLGIGAATGLVAAVRLWRGRAGPGRGDWRWLVAAAGLGLVLWLPPLVDEVVHEPGNLTKIVDHLGTPTEASIGLREAARFMVLHLDAWHLVAVAPAHPGTYIDILSGPGPTRARGLLCLATWVASVGVAIALRHRRLLALHALIGWSAGIGVLAMARIYGIPWPYLMLWAYGIGALLALAVAATVAVLLARWAPPGRRATVTSAMGITGLVAVVVVSLRLLALAPDATTGTPDQTAQLARITPPTLAALAERTGAASGTAGRYLVEFSDATNGGSEGIGLVNELVRHGYRAGVPAEEGVRMGAARVLPPDAATARLVVASGGWIERWAGEPGAVRVAYDDPRSAAERSEFADTRARAIAALTEEGRADLVDELDTDLLDIALNQGVGGGAGMLVARMLDIGVPIAVFVLPPEGAP